MTITSTKQDFRTGPIITKSRTFKQPCYRNVHMWLNPDIYGRIDRQTECVFNMMENVR